MSKSDQSGIAGIEVQAPVWVAAPVPLGGGRSAVDSIRERITSGQALLKVVEYPWGVEFDVSNPEGSR